MIELAASKKALKPILSWFLATPLTNIEVLQDVLLVMSDGRLALKRIPFAVAD